MKLFIGASESYDEDAWEFSNLKKENAKLREENAKLVKVLHEVESEAVDAFLGLQHDCELLTAELDDRFRKHWHEQCENEKLKDLLADCLGAPCIDCDPWDEGFDGCRHCDGGDCTLVARAHKLGVEARP